MLSLAPTASASGIRFSRFDKHATKQSKASRKTKFPVPDEDASKSLEILLHQVIRSLQLTKFQVPLTSEHLIPQFSTIISNSCLTLQAEYLKTRTVTKSDQYTYTPFPHHEQVKSLYVKSRRTAQHSGSLHDQPTG